MKRILIVRTDRVGDVVMITGMLRELRKSFPDAYIGTLTQQNTSHIITNNPNVNVIIKDDLSKDSYWKVIKEIRRHKFTHGLLVMPTERAAYQMFLAGIKNRIGVGHKLYEIITFMKSVSRNNYTPLRHEADYDMDLARKLGVVSNNILPEIFVTKEEKSAIKKVLSGKGLNEKDYKIIVHTGSGGSSPNWSEGKYLSLIKNILTEFNKPNYKIILTAREMSDNFVANLKGLNSNRIVIVTGLLKNLRSLINIISVSDVLISSSTGPVHLAAGLKIKAIGMYCNRAMNCAKHWGILNKGSLNLQISDEYCRSHCSADQNTCVFEDGISIEQVIESLKLLVKNKQTI